MKTILSEKLVRILKNKKRLQEILNIKITNRGKEVSIQGTPEDEYIAEKVIDALNFGFPFGHATTIKEQDFIFERINIKDHTTRSNLSRVRGRLIGKLGKSLSTLHQLTKCFFELKDNEIGIIGDPEHIQNAQESVISIIKGSKHSNVYSFLEKRQVKQVIDLGLKRQKE